MVASWVAGASEGSCGVTSAKGDCDGGDRGSLGLADGEEVSWEAAAHGCLLRCAGCASCHWVTISLAAKDCSWFRGPCSLGALPPLPSGLPFKPADFKTAAAPPWHLATPKVYEASLATARGAALNVSEQRWSSYVRRLYGGEGDGVPSLGDVDLIYDQLLPISVDLRLEGQCPKRTHAPFVLRAPHSPLLPWLPRYAPSEPFASHSWAEVTHCGGSTFERAGGWFYAARGSALFVNVGRTMSFRSHAEAARRFLGSGCRNGMMCSDEMGEFTRRARAEGLDSLQFLRHCDLECDDCSHEIVLTAADGTGACPAGVAFRTGAKASKPCTCEETSSVRSSRGHCAACREWGFERWRLSPVAKAVASGTQGVTCGQGCWQQFATAARSG